MNLKENYERFFGKIEPIKQEVIIEALTPEQQNRFVNVCHVLAKKYPNTPLTMHEGYVCINGKKIEKASTFLNKSSLTIQEIVRVKSQKS